MVILISERRNMRKLSLIVLSIALMLTVITAQPNKKPGGLTRSLKDNIKVEKKNESYPIDPRSLPFIHEQRKKLLEKYGSFEKMMEQTKSNNIQASQGIMAVQEGDTEQLWAYNMETGSYEQVSATCRGVGENVYVMVEDAKWDDGTVNQTMVDNFIAAFDDDSNNVLNTPSDYTDGDAPNGDGIYGLDTYYFGDPPDVDNDPKICIFLLDIKDGYTGSGGYIAGYFDPTNESSDSNSNQREMLYVDVYPADPTSLNTLGNTVAHEFQHLIHFNLDYDETSWVNEACSEFAGWMTTGSARSNYQYSSNSNDPLASWGQQLIDYDQVSLFSVFFAEITGNSTNIRELAQDTLNGRDSVDSALSDLGSSETFNSLFEKWYISNYLDEPSSGYGYNFIDFTTMKNFQSHTTFPASNSDVSLNSTGTQYIRFTEGNDLSLNFNGDDSGSFTVYTIKNSIDMTPQVEKISLDGVNDFSQTFDNYGDTYSELILAVTNLGSSSTTFSYDADATSIGTEIAYDDGTPDETSDGYTYLTISDGQGFGVRFTPEQYPAKVLKAKLYTLGNNVSFDVKICDDSGTDGKPGDVLASKSITVESSTQDWVMVTFDTPAVIDSGDFYVVATVPGSDGEAFAHDFSSEFDDRSWFYTSSDGWMKNSDFFSQTSDYQEYAEAEWMFRSVVEYVDLEVDPIADCSPGSTVTVSWSSAGKDYSYQIQKNVNDTGWTDVGSSTTGTSQDITCDTVGSWNVRVVASKNGTSITSNEESFSVSSVQDLSSGPAITRVVNDSDTFLILNDNLNVEWTDSNDNTQYNYSYAVSNTSETPSSFTDTQSGSNDYFELSSSDGDYPSEGGNYWLHIKCVNSADSNDYRIFSTSFNIVEFKPVILPNIIDDDYVTILIAAKGLTADDKALNDLLYVTDESTTYNDLRANSAGNFYSQTDFNTTEFLSTTTFNLYCSHSKLTGDVAVDISNGSLTYQIVNIKENPYAVDRRVKLISERDKKVSVIRVNYPELAGVSDVQGRIYHIGKINNDTVNYDPSKGYKLQKWTGNKWKDVSAIDESGYYAVVTGSLVPKVDRTSLNQNYPNPFNPETNIPITIKEAGHVKLSIYDSKGKLVKVLLNRYISSPVKNKPIHWNGKNSRGRNVSSGVYYAVLEVNGERYMNKMVMLK
ncbi:MAG: T9SS type A sorting domain-containing protein [Candidatus Mcinerneyibacterium aminivorans]|uniref:T9SS type A sorting domain-containing protein n=1 Tax=Candidatus Mcinerneyibacterium aminivorans TaxID=2703815 RepID=A0A5D0MHM0_9BACT|nr:MAG: T9SS type A sorting domain-containing protein [Candidatus Mcinerneyibacterium aminivorans]